MNEKTPAVQSGGRESQEATGDTTSVVATADGSLPLFLELLHAHRAGHLVISWRNVGGDRWQSEWCSDVDAAEAVIRRKAAAADVYLGLNPMRPGPDGRKRGRGSARDVAALVSLFVDLDVKPDACRDLEHAHRVADALDELLTIRCVRLLSGNGLQLFVPLAEPLMLEDEAARTDAAALLRRWGALVALVAREEGARVDATHDLARIARVPEAINHKDPEAPKPTRLLVSSDDQLPVEDLRHLLDLYVPAVMVSEDAVDVYRPGTVAPSECQRCEQFGEQLAATVAGEIRAMRPCCLQQLCIVQGGSARNSTLEEPRL